MGIKNNVKKRNLKKQVVQSHTTMKIVNMIFDKQLAILQKKFNIPDEAIHESFDEAKAEFAKVSKEFIEGGK